MVEQKSAGHDLTKASKQAGDYFDALSERDRPRYILVSNFQTFELRDLYERERTFFALADLPRNVQKFGFILFLFDRYPLIGHDWDSEQSPPGDYRKPPGTPQAVAGGA